MTQLTDIERAVLATVRRRSGPLHRIAHEVRVPPGQALDALEHLIELGRVEKHAVVVRLGEHRHEIFYRERFT